MTCKHRWVEAIPKDGCLAKYTFQCIRCAEFRFVK